MARPYFTVNGVDFLQYIEEGGLKWTDNDVDSPDSGRTLDGKMHRGKVTSKVKYEAKCLPLPTASANIVFGVLDHEYVTVSTNIDPKKGVATYEMYNSSRPATCFVVDAKTGEGTWNDISFSLIER